MGCDIVSPTLLTVSWRAPKHVIATSTTRSGGYSKGIFSSFNLGEHVGDNIEHVASNRALLAASLNLPNDIQWLNQVHSGDVTCIECHSNAPITADAAFTRKSNIPLAILTADCLPILISNKQGTEIAAIHAGWRPLAANIIDTTIKCFDSKPEDLLTWLGPCISSDSFEVGQDVVDKFMKLDSALTSAFEPQSNTKYLANLHVIAKHLLNKLGVNQITAHTDCTFFNTDKYFSYRRDGKTGRMATVVCINN